MTGCQFLLILIITLCKGSLVYLPSTHRASEVIVLHFMIHEKWCKRKINKISNWCYAKEFFWNFCILLPPLASTLALVAYNLYILCNLSNLYRSREEDGGTREWLNSINAWLGLPLWCICGNHDNPFLLQLYPFKFHIWKHILTLSLILFRVSLW